MTRAANYIDVDPAKGWIDVFAPETARATGRLANTDRVDAEMLAQMSAALRPSPTPPPKSWSQSSMPC